MGNPPRESSLSQQESQMQETPTTPETPPQTPAEPSHQPDAVAAAASRFAPGPDRGAWPLGGGTRIRPAAAGGG